MDKLPIELMSRIIMYTERDPREYRSISHAWEQELFQNDYDRITLKGNFNFILINIKFF